MQDLRLLIMDLDIRSEQKESALAGQKAGVWSCNMNLHFSVKRSSDSMTPLALLLWICSAQCSLLDWLQCDFKKQVERSLYSTRAMVCRERDWMSRVLQGLRPLHCAYNLDSLGTVIDSWTMNILWYLLRGFVIVGFQDWLQSRHRFSQFCSFDSRLI